MRAIILNVENGNGFVPNLLSNQNKSRDYENNVYFVNYEKLLKNQLIPGLPLKSVIAM
jgi:hypothetical protein